MALHPQIGGIQKNSMIDYPGKVSCVIFFSGCNFLCPYCHNPSLVRKTAPLIFPLDIIFLLNFRRKFTDAVVITGGEPTLQPHLISFISQIREMGFLVKLDTNGSRPDVITELIRRKLVDYIAMDIKTDPADFWFYSFLIREHLHPDTLVRSIYIIMDSGVPYEFRTTCVYPFVDEEKVRNICQHVIPGAQKYVFQKFNQDGEHLSPSFNMRPCPDDEIARFGEIAEMYVKESEVR